MDNHNLKCDRCDIDNPNIKYYQNKWGFVLCGKCRKSEVKEIQKTYEFIF